MSLETRATSAASSRSAAELLPQIYEALRELARQMVARRRQRETLQPTALVNEAAIRFMKQHGMTWDGPEHLFVALATAMRRVLIDRARRRNSLKRGGGIPHVPLEDEVADASEIAVDDATLLSLESALEELEKEDARTYRVVIMRFYLGMRTADIAEIENRAARSVDRDWRFARAWLHSRLNRF